MYKDLDNAGDVSEDEKKIVKAELQDDKKKALQTESLFRRILIDLFETETFSLLKLQDPYDINITKLEPKMVGSISEGFGLVENLQLGEEDSDESVIRDEVDFNLVWKKLKILDPGHLKSIKTEEKGATSYFDAQVEFSSEFPGYAAIKLVSNDAMYRWVALSNVLINSDGSKVEVYLHPEAVSDEFFMQLRVQSILCTLVANLEMFVSDDNEGNQALLTKYTRFKDKMSESLIKEKPFSESDGNEHQEQVMQEESVTTDINKNIKNSLSPRILFILDQAGPAVSINMFDKRLKGGSFTFDMAPSLPLENWPSIANEWISRHRTSEWPGRALISSIVQEGCSLVPICPTQSQTGLEWRISFSSSERMLAQSLTELQKVCYLTVKAIWRHFLKHPKKKGLQSYHLKTTMFWVCEEFPSNEWASDNTARGVLRILQKLYTFLVNMCCPHYFVPSNNLFQDIEGGVLIDTLQRVTIAILSRRQVWYDNPGLFTALPPELSRLHFYDLEDKAFREGIGNIFRFCFDLMVEAEEESMNTDSDPLVTKMICNIKATLEKCCRSQDSSIYFLAGFFMMFTDAIIQGYQASAYDMRRFLGSRISPRMLALRDPIPLDIFIKLSASLEMFKLAFKLFSQYVIHNEEIDGNVAEDNRMTDEESGWDGSIDDEDRDLYPDEMIMNLIQALENDSDMASDEDDTMES